MAGVVTLLFTDLVGSTELLSRLGEDAAEELRQDHFRLLREAVGEAGGEEVKSLGDGLMVAFSSPVQAVGCAVAMQRVIAEYNRTRPERALRVRVGLHAGEPAEEGGDFHGTPVVVAKRLCDGAEGGQILASRLVEGLVGSKGGFVFRRVGRLELKGLPRPVDAVAVEWAPAPSPPAAAPRTWVPPAASPRGPRLVGRDAELGVLEAELDRAAAGELRCVLVLGEPGVGKTRLAGELLARHPVIGLPARAHALGATAAFGLWAEALERHLRELDPEDVEQLCAGFLDDLAGLVRSVASVRGGAPAREPSRQGVLQGLAVVVGNLAARGPVVVFLDDVHHADVSSWEALHYLAHNAPDARLLIVATARPGELADHAVAGDILGGLEQEGLLRRMTLAPLPYPEVGDLAEAVLGRRPPAALTGWLETKSKGNPLFALGLLQALLDEGADLTAPVLRSLPETLAERVTSRMRQLEFAGVALIELLAVVGRAAPLGPLAELSGLASDELAGVLERLVRSRMVIEEERGRDLYYEIAHPLAGEAIYQGIGGARRRTLHRQVGRALAAAGRLGEAAAHMARGADVGDDEAVGILSEAVRQAEGRGAYQEALTILGSLVELLPAGDERWLGVVDSMGPAEWVVDHRADTYAELGIEALRVMDQALEALPDPAPRATVKFRLASFLAWGTGDADEAERVGREALALFETAGDRGALLARHELAWTAGIKGEFETMEAETDAVLADARTAGDETVALRALRTVAIVRLLSGRFREARELLSQTAEAARHQGNAYVLTMSLITTAISLVGEGRTREAFPFLEEARRVNPSWRDYGLLEYETWLWCMAGDFPRALDRARQALAATPGEVSKRRGLGLAFAALAAIEVGEVAEAERFLSRARATYAGKRWLYHSSTVTWGEAMLAFHRGHRDEAVSLLRQAIAELPGVAAGQFAPAVVQLAEWTEDPGLATEAASELERIARETGLDSHRGLAGIAAAWAALARDDPMTAAARAEEAAEILSRLDWPLQLGQAFEVLGRALAGADRSKAVAALERAAAGYEACGATRRRQQVAEVLARLGSRGKRAAAAALGPASLTGREREVAALAAQGCSAKEIGERLYIGERTVEGHLARAYAKLGVASKVELVRRAAELGLSG